MPYFRDITDTSRSDSVTERRISPNYSKLMLSAWRKFTRIGPLLFFKILKVEHQPLQFQGTGYWKFEQRGTVMLA